MITQKEILEVIQKIVIANKQLNMDAPAAQELFARLIHERFVEVQNIALLEQREFDEL
tara:strand:+ start:227 stop:400 length:174 start_codon:yes stop_codon:yes gene_type:complete